MDLDGIDELSDEGSDLLKAVSNRDVIFAHDGFEEWVENGSNWLRQKFPNSGMVSKWIGISSSPLVEGGDYFNDVVAISRFKSAVRIRLDWLGQLHLFVPQRQSITSSKINDKLPVDNCIIGSGGGGGVFEFVSSNRIKELDDLKSDDFDVKKIVRICEELNKCRESECYISMILLMRCMIDHVPPVFGKRNFKEVVSNYSGSRSFKKSMDRLDVEMRNIADMHLHSHIRKSDSLPNFNQINYSSLIDLLLSEVVSILRGNSIKSR